MPKSKRNKQVDLSKTRKRGLEGKKHLYEVVRSCVDNYAHIFVFSVNDMRNAKMKNVREQWKHSRFFIGKNKVMVLALGRSESDEYQTGLHKLGNELKGQRGLLFSNQDAEEVVSWFENYSESEFARSGNMATEDVTLQEGPLEQFPHNLEPYLRQLGLPTTLQKGIVYLIKDHVVCKTGDILTPETAKILKLLHHEMAEFKVKIECVWSKDGTFKKLGGSDTNFKENGDKLSRKKKSLPKADKSQFQIESMDIAKENEDEGNALADIGAVSTVPEETCPVVKEIESQMQKKKKKDKKNKQKLKLNADEGVKEDESVEECVTQPERVSSEYPGTENTGFALLEKMKSPLVEEKKPKFSPKMLRSAKKKLETDKKIEENKNILEKLDISETQNTRRGRSLKRSTPY